MAHRLRHPTTPLPAFEQATVGDVMHVGVIGCPPDADVETIASAMADHRIHCVVVDGIVHEEGGGERLVWGIVSDLDLLHAGTSRRGTATAAQLAATEAVTTYPGDSLERASQLMVEHDVNHLVVTSLESGRPVGVISTLDLVAALAWGGR